MTARDEIEGTICPHGYTLRSACIVCDPAGHAARLMEIGAEMRATVKRPPLDATSREDSGTCAEPTPPAHTRPLLLNVSDWPPGVTKCVRVTPEGIAVDGEIVAPTCLRCGIRERAAVAWDRQPQGVVETAWAKWCHRCLADDTTVDYAMAAVIKAHDDCCRIAKLLPGSSGLPPAQPTETEQRYLTARQGFDDAITELREVLRGLGIR